MANLFFEHEYQDYRVVFDEVVLNPHFIWNEINVRIHFVAECQEALLQEDTHLQVFPGVSECFGKRHKTSYCENVSLF
jgi:hypothetical protein